MKPGAQTCKLTGRTQLLSAFSSALLLCTLLIPSANAFTFDEGDSGSNPFFFDGQSTTSSWTLYLGETEQSNWATGDIPSCSLDTGLCVSVISPSGVVIAGSADINSTTAWTSGTTSIPYYISFDWQYEDLGDPAISTPFYKANGVETFLLGTNGSITSATLDSGSGLTFGITNVDGFGDLTISNFNATPVPAPLPLLGAAAAFGAIRRRRATLRLRQSSATRAASRRQ